MEEILKEIIEANDKITSGETKKKIREHIKKLLLTGNKTFFFLGKRWSWEELKQFFLELDLKEGGE
ncbi:MAG: hypothetical protein QXP60_05680 [Nitrososphaerota archaeon]